MMNPETKILGKIWRGAFFTIIGIGFAKLLGLFYKIVVAKAGAYNYGLLTLGIGVAGFAGIFATIGLDTAVMRYVAYYSEKKDAARIKGTITSAFKVAATLSLLLAVLMFLFAKYLAVTIFHNPDLTLVFRIMAVAIPFDSLRKIILGISKAFQYVKYEIYIEHLIKNTAKLLFTIAAILFTKHVFGLTVAFTLSSILATIIGLYFLENGVFKIFRNPTQAIPSYKQLLSFSWPLLFADIFFLLLVWTDSMMLGYFLDAKQVGIYNAATPISLFLYLFSNSLIAIFLPIITNLHRDGKREELGSIYRVVTRWLFVANVMMLGGVFIFSQQIIQFIFGAEYTAASFSLIILSVGYVMHATFLTSHRMLVAFGRTKILFVNGMLTFVLNCALNSLFIPRFGIAGAALATTISFTFLTVQYIISLRVIDKLKTFSAFMFLQILPVIAVTTLVYFSRHLFKGLAFLGGLLLVPLLSLLLIYLLKLFTPLERDLLQSLLAKMRIRKSQAEIGTPEVDTQKK